MPDPPSPIPVPTDSSTAKPSAPVELPLASPAGEAPARRPIPPSPGEVITSEMTKNTYTMGQKIGEGHFGIVFSAADVWGNQLAVKVMKPLGSYEKVKKSTQEEFHKLVLLRHPNITYLFDAWEYRDTFYLVTERCECSLADLVAQEWFDGSRWLRGIARCLLQAVHYIHLNGYCHQDIHLGNMFTAIVRNELAAEEAQQSQETAMAIQFKLGDLGVARLFEEVDATNTRNLGMLPPEALNSAEFGPMDHRLDIYHCGLLLLQVASSKELRFTEDEIKAGKPRELASQLPPPWNFALEKALRRHVGVRTASAMELWRDLNPSDLPRDAGPEQLALPTGITNETTSEPTPPEAGL